MVAWALPATAVTLVGAPGTETVPLPPNTEFSHGVVKELLATRRVADFAAIDVGLNITLTVQLVPAARVGVTEQEPPVPKANWFESVPVKEIVETTTAASPPLDKVKVTGADCLPISVAANVLDEGERVKEPSDQKCPERTGQT